MNIVTKVVVCNNESLLITNQRAVFWNREKMLIISDLHVGKAAHFRRNGIPISSEVLDNDLSRLKELILYFNPDIIVVTGDLFHAKMNLEFSVFSNWLKPFDNIEKILVKGNHDKINVPISNMFHDWRIVETYSVDPFEFIHDGGSQFDKKFQISGHTHPGVLIKGKARQRIKLPCYQLTKNQLILPAFSLFTGLNLTKPEGKVINYAFTEESIFEMS